MNPIRGRHAPWTPTSTGFAASWVRLGISSERSEVSDTGWRTEKVGETANEHILPGRLRAIRERIDCKKDVTAITEGIEGLKVVRVNFEFHRRTTKNCPFTFKP